jgi:hypothetical protein
LAFALRCNSNEDTKRVLTNVEGPDRDDPKHNSLRHSLKQVISAWSEGTPVAFDSTESVVTKCKATMAHIITMHEKCCQRPNVLEIKKLLSKDEWTSVGERKADAVRLEELIKAF